MQNLRFEKLFLFFASVGSAPSQREERETKKQVGKVREKQIQSSTTSINIHAYIFILYSTYIQNLMLIIL